MNPVKRNRLAGLALALLIFAVDQWSKWWVTGPLGINQIGDYREILPFFDLRYVRNYGVSLGMFEATSPEMRWVTAPCVICVRLKRMRLPSLLSSVE